MPSLTCDAINYTYCMYVRSMNSEVTATVAVAAAAAVAKDGDEDATIDRDMIYMHTCADVH